MSLKIGTLVYLRMPPHIRELLLRNGIIGEVVDGTRWHSELPVGEVVVDFPHNKSDTRTGLWRAPETWLIPISGPDIEIGDEDVVKKTDKTPVEERV
jgi:hypothetical protein